MPRNARMVLDGEPAIYHVISRTALAGFVLGDPEKDYLLQLIKHLSSIYFTEILGFCLMGNHFHLTVKMRPGSGYSDEEIRKRFEKYYANDNKILMASQIPGFCRKWSSLSEFVKEIKQRYSRYYNKRHKRKGFFWSDRFKSVLVEEGDTLINLLAYIDLNPVRAGIVDRPEDYRWNSLGYHLQTGNTNGFLSLDFGVPGMEKKSKKSILKLYRQFLYEKGSLGSGKGKFIPEKVFQKEKKKGFEPTTIDRFRLRTRYFTDSGIIGSKEFVRRSWDRLKGGNDLRDKIPLSVAGIKGMYSLKRLNECI
jgi:REP-associated tyrosine transposase